MPAMVFKAIAVQFKGGPRSFARQRIRALAFGVSQRFGDRRFRLRDRFPGKTRMVHARVSRQPGHPGEFRVQIVKQPRCGARLRNTQANGRQRPARLRLLGGMVRTEGENHENHGLLKKKSLMDAEPRGFETKKAWEERGAKEKRLRGSVSHKAQKKQTKKPHKERLRCLEWFLALKYKHSLLPCESSSMTHSAQMTLLPIAPRKATSQERMILDQMPSGALHRGLVQRAAWIKEAARGGADFPGALSAETIAEMWSDWRFVA